jgi:hypothetical protein
MKTTSMWVVLFLGGWWLWTGFAAAKTVYLVPPGTPGVIPVKPFTNGWANASTNMCGVIGRDQSDWSVKANDTLLISNGTYELSSVIYPQCTGARILSVTTNPADVVIIPAPGHPANALFYLNIGPYGAETTWMGLTFSNSPYRAVENYQATNVTFRNCVFTESPTVRSMETVPRADYSASEVRSRSARQLPSVVWRIVRSLTTGIPTRTAMHRVAVESIPIRVPARCATASL